MKLGSQRSAEAMKPVLQQAESTGPDPVYWVFGEVSEEKWANLTITAPGKFGTEYPKTFGHYHPEDAPVETYHVISGHGVFVLQKKFVDDQGHWDHKKVAEVLLVKGEPGDTISITKDWGHSWSNVGNQPLLTFDDWRSGHTPQDYAPIEELHGLAYYLTEENDEIKPVPNPNYQDLPEPKWVTAQEFADAYGK